MNVKILYGYQKREEVTILFSEYIKMLIEKDASIKGCLALQDYDEEIKHLEKKYGIPDGRLYLLYCDEKAAGCIGLSKINDQLCEMKRLYIRPEFRGKKLGEILVEKIITKAREIGYSHMLLDTLPFLQNAVHLYKKFRFYEIERYNDNPMDTAIYMKLDL